ncbi:hypothetical protein GQ42DRAFT_53258 [Ramicandelaber brevisporus]|nr:hypothetical protein GQ42DRAFT_53258 [Ramicandelaber brevisporus]
MQHLLQQQSHPSQQNTQIEQPQHHSVQLGSTSLQSMALQPDLIQQLNALLQSTELQRNVLQSPAPQFNLFQLPETAEATESSAEQQLRTPIHSSQGSFSSQLLQSMSLGDPFISFTTAPAASQPAEPAATSAHNHIQVPPVTVPVAAAAATAASDTPLLTIEQLLGSLMGMDAAAASTNIEGATAAAATVPTPATLQSASATPAHPLQLSLDTSSIMPQHTAGAAAEQTPFFDIGVDITQLEQTQEQLYSFLWGCNNQQV